MKKILILILLFISSLCWADEFRGGCAESGDDGQQSPNGFINISYGYMELMKNSVVDRWGGAMRIPNVTIPQGATINSAYVQLWGYATTWKHASDTIACEDVDSASIITTTDYDISDRWSSRTTAFVTWHDDISGVYPNPPDSTPDLKTLVQEIVDRVNWESGNAMIFLFKNLTVDPGVDSAALEIYTWDAGSHTIPESLFVDYTAAAAEEVKLLPIRK